MIESYPTALYASGILDHAASVLEGRLSSSAPTPALFQTLGQIYRKQGRLTEAAAMFDRLTELAPDDRRAQSLSAILDGRVPPAWPESAPLQPAPFVLLRDFLPPEFHDTLLPLVLAAPEEDLILSTVGKDEYRPDLRISLTVGGMKATQKAFWGHVAAVLPSLLDRLHVPPFEVGKTEIRTRTYRAGHFFEVHRDNSIPETADRRVSFVYFFHRVPRRYTGGDLLLIDTSPDLSQPPITNFTRIVPVDNAIVFFPSPFYHAVVPVACTSEDPGDTRFVINGHIRRKVEAAA
jgi:hypothetical protein